MDPGNWSTGLVAGSAFGYKALFVVLLSNWIAIFLQYLSVKLGLASGRDLAQSCRASYHPKVNYVLWFLAECAVAATDLAEVLGSAIGLNLLSNGAIPIWGGVLITAADVIVLILVSGSSIRILESVVGCLILTILGCFAFEVASANPDWGKVGRGLIPSSELVTNPKLLYVSIGILGATVMPHNLYLHSSLVQTRHFEKTVRGRQQAIRYCFIDSTASLLVAFLINAAILILAGSAFYYGTPQRKDVEDLTQAHALLDSAIGTRAASILFAVALLASGQNSTITGTLAGQVRLGGDGHSNFMNSSSLECVCCRAEYAFSSMDFESSPHGQVVMEGFLQIKLKPWIRRLVTRLVAIVPAAIVAAIMGNEGVTKLLVLSQVILSLQLSFAVFPLVQFTSSKKHLGGFANGWPLTLLGYATFVFIAGLNIYLLYLGTVGGAFKI